MTMVEINFSVCIIIQFLDSDDYDQLEDINSQQWNQKLSANSHDLETQSTVTL